MVGPCLCGDPYCPSCGDPSAAEFEEWIERFTDKLIEAKIDIFEAKFIENSVFVLLKVYRDNIKDIIAEARQGDLEYIDHLKDRLVRIEKKSI